MLKSLTIQLIEQLKAPGRMLIPVGRPHGSQYLIKVDKDEQGHVKQEELFGVAFVPLT
jgi:protein-L-isoaspartate(D-aspartate) O-methyltransferase